MARPAIGICAPVERARFGPWDQDAVLLPRGYSDAVQGAGGLAFMLAPDDDLAQRPAELLDRLDGLLLAGGRDIDPLAYGAKPAEATQDSSPERDRFELGLATAALDRDMPLLGVCRGMQLMNVACGGTLVQDLPAELSGRHRHTPGAFADHEVVLERGSLAAHAAGAERLSVRSHHHQGLDELGSGLVASGRSPEDGIVEAVELPGKRFALGVLWHPEEDTASGVIPALVAAASAS
jgi:putative glutamine amidotransferase